MLYYEKLWPFEKGRHDEGGSDIIRTGMKKILIAEELKAILVKDAEYLGRSDVTLITAATNDELLAVHREEGADLIIAPLDMPGMKSERLYTTIRNDRKLRMVSVIIICPGIPSDIERSSRCGANAVLTRPIDVSLLLERARQLMDISARESYRVLLSTTIEGNSKDTSFFCRSENISATGLLLDMEKVLKKGERLTCKFSLPNVKQIKASGEIIRVIKQEAGTKTNRYGFKFSQLSEEAREAIEDFVHRKSQISTSKK
jgi:DNA-binding response OmpR family regulator